MVDLTRPDDDELVNDFRVGVDFFVGARDFGEARVLIERALHGETGGVPEVEGGHVRPTADQVWGVRGWQQVPPRPSQAALMQNQYPGLVNDAAAMEVLQALIRAGDRPLAVSDLAPEATRQRVAQIVGELNRDVLVDDPDAPGRLVYHGPADEAAMYLAEGTYRAFDGDDREYALVVAPSELASSGRISQAIPRDRHDSRTLDEIAQLLQDHRPDQSLTELFRQVNRRLETTRRTGFPSWMPLDAKPENAPDPVTEPTQVHVGVIIWTDLENQEPTILVDTNPVRLTRNLATTLHESLDGDPGFEGAAEFLDHHPSPQEWKTPEDVDVWLDALSASTPYPAVSIQRREIGTPNPAAGPAEAPVTDHAAPATEAGGAAKGTVHGEPVFTYEVPVHFSVSARTAAEARRMIDDALTGGAEPATPARVQRGQLVRVDGDVEGVLGWHHDDEEAASSDLGTETNPVTVVLRERAHDLDTETERTNLPPAGPGSEPQAREPR
ncbi:hypothetical protein [Nesterenkonia alkaliphila]|uniref:Uncharacterized protein n=1 Tax=Nesterenkonia alkaliphila TaxID=1463631 RepID=A0A7K1UFC2_9MICC|nr:hypothetical protein [Nesterenkonia alkaliphila]MVT25084.1 hypothetical protein [Nesterenkonia alkaliphila]GFZ83098.1 hypothetical protein GCM10011359_09760 [Nesterenkonia alkaliphila]